MKTIPPSLEPRSNANGEEFSYVKFYFKEHDELWQTMTNPNVLVQVVFESVSSSHCDGWITSSEYPY